MGTRAKPLGSHSTAFWGPTDWWRGVHAHSPDLGMLGELRQDQTLSARGLTLFSLDLTHRAGHIRACGHGQAQARQPPAQSSLPKRVCNAHQLKASFEQL